MKNTLKNKSTFFAQYWGQKIMNMTVNENDFLQTIGFTYMNKYKVENCHLELKPLSMVSDKEKNEINKIEEVGECENPESYFNFNDSYEACYYENEGFIRFPLLETYQFLQSQGYALPWMSLSVETLIEYGWIKLKTK